jgi:hypothetical protein
VTKLKRHLFLRLQLRASVGSGERQASSTSDLNIEESVLAEGATKVVIQGQRIFRHKLMYLNYTTYDLRQDQDIVNPSSSRRDVMFLGVSSADGEEADDHRHIYGRVLGIFHVNAMVADVGSDTRHWQRFDLLWIRWFKPLGPEQQWSSKRLDVLAFPPVSEPDSFSFADPEDALRACHITPRFSKGISKPSRCDRSVCADNRNDWREYFVNRCVLVLSENMAR